MKIEHLVRRDYLTVNPYSGINAIKKQLLEYSAIVVQDEEQFYGVLSPKDIVSNPRTLIIDCLTNKSIIGFEHSVEEVLGIMTKSNTDVLPVGKNDKIIGLVFKDDLYNYIAEYNTELEKKIQERTKELELSVSMKDMMFSVIAHDLKNPFNSILGYSDLLSNNLNQYTLEEIDHQIKIIRSQTNTACVLLDNLLDWAKSKTGQLGFNPVYCDISTICKQVVDHLKFSAQMKSISIDCFHSPDVAVYADKNMVESILRNLISNAIKYTRINGKVQIYTLLNEDFVEIIVSDDGVGLSDADKEKLFDPTKTKSHLGTANEKGTGLGLVICKEFVEKNNGKIWIENKTDNGSKFLFTLPKYHGQKR